MNRDNPNPNQSSGNQQRPDTRQEDYNDGANDEDSKHLTIGEGATKEDGRLIGRAEEIEEAPGSEEREEDYERERVGDE